MLLPRRRLETSIETHPRPLLLEGRAEVPSNKRGFRGVYIVFQKAKLLQYFYFVKICVHLGQNNGILWKDILTNN